MTEIELINFLDEKYETQLESRNWRNSENVTKYFQLKHIDEETHRNWLESLKKENPSNVAFFVKYENDIIGVSYFRKIDRETKTCDWGLYIYKDNLRGKGIGKEILLKSMEYAKNELHMEKVFLEVLEDNDVARKLYEKKGFTYLHKKDNVLRFLKII